ncbi:MAG: tRNA lysidine(34) synthetase TilS [Rhodobacteraceae bacterium]|nr:tRNA lysidine(34) synthetase TilS [Paracoccaceae bacterium]MBR27157.1 tRNA lysidine(34) synthetase TilS [Paracoccaceae bacterium]
MTVPDFPPAPRAGPGDAARAAETRAALRDRLEALAPPRLGVAVSGGGDSLALLLAARGWAAADPARRLEVATVDHRLRAEAAEEARAVARLCARLGLNHAVLAWAEPAPGRNLAAAARDARAALIAGWAGDRGLGAVALGHTRDDQAETLLMRLARGSGLDGLAAMREDAVRAGARWLRPALGVGREDLRAVLRDAEQGWFDDPSNDDPARDRVRARRALGLLAPLGIGAQGLAATAARLAADADHIGGEVAALGAAALRIGGAGELILDRARLRAAPPALTRRLLGRLIRLTGGAEHPPRAAALAALEAGLRAPGPAPARALGGCLISAEDGPRPAIRLHREPAAAPPAVAAPGPWDARWQVEPPEMQPEVGPGDIVIGALGEPGLIALTRLARDPDTAWTPLETWAAAPRAARAAAPCLRRDGALIAAPLAGLGAATVHDLLPARISR